MALAPGTRLGPYEIAAQIGVGGMGEVYQATDTNLKRAVAIKVLPEAVATDAERLARFQREAEVLAALNHPNIAAIYGLERAEGTTALVMELVEGPTLAEVIAARAGRAPAAAATSESSRRGAAPSGGGHRRASGALASLDEAQRAKSGAPRGLSIDEALPIARQIAEALEAAHEAGIIHRDLKPANIKVRPDGTVKVLDFGLAKAMEPTPGSDVGMSQSPTITTPAMTRAGMILGTAAYMSPEQAKGRPADRRSDVWAFGSVLFEMLAGQRAFQGVEVSDVFASVLARDPAFAALPDAVPPRIRQLLRACLQKDTKQRIHDIADVRLAMAGAFESAAPAASDRADAPSSPLRRLALPVVATAVVVGVVAALVGRMSVSEPDRPVVRSIHLLEGPGSFFRNPVWNVIDIAPGGERFVYNRFGGLVIRELDSFDEHVIPDTGGDGIGFPLLSPDGQSVAYFDFRNGELQRIAATGGAPQVLASAEDMWGASWGRDGTILYGQEDGVYEVSENGDEPPHRLIGTEPGRVMDTPQRLPGGDWILFTLAEVAGGPTRWDDAEIVAESLTTHERRTVWSGGSNARALPTGHLVFLRQNVMYGMPFDVDRLEVSGSPVPVILGVQSAGNQDSNISAAFFGVSERGDLVYVPGTRLAESLSLGLVNRMGQAEPLAMRPGVYNHPRVSPDGRRLAVTTVYPDGTDISVYEIGSGNAPRRLTFNRMSRYPVWSSDGDRVAFQSVQDGEASVFWQPFDASEPAVRLTTPEAGAAHIPNSFSASGEWLLFTASVRGDSSVWRLSLETGEAEPLLAEPGADISQAVFSPDDRWIAYQTTETGRNEIFVQPFPLTDAKHELPGSLDDHHPFWSPDGRQLFYVPGPTQFHAVDVTTDAGFDFGNPVEINLNGVLRMAGPNEVRRVDIMPDGRFLGLMGEIDPQTGTLRDPAISGGQINMVQNWFTELKRLVPTK